MNKTSKKVADAANINALSNLTKEDLNSIMNTVRKTELKGFSKNQQDDFLGDAILHLCEKAEKGYFKNVQDLKGLQALTYTILKNKSSDVRDKANTFRKHVKIDRQDISDMYNCGFDPADDVDDLEEPKVEIHRYIKTLPGKEGDVMRLSFEGYTDEEIMKRLEMSRSYVQKSRSIAKAKLVKAMKTNGYGRISNTSETRLSAEAESSADFFCA